jgi:nucleotide-binding universal stress UspA family protein
VVQTHLGIVKPDEEILTLSEELEAGLIVVGSRGRGGIRRALMGSVCDSVVRRAHCPVLDYSVFAKSCQRKLGFREELF